MSDTPEVEVVRTAPKTVEVRIAELPAFYASLGRAVVMSGGAGAQPSQTLPDAVRAECSRCGATLTGAELCELTIVEEITNLPPKLKRLRLGYCARPACESYEYRIHLAEHPGLDWQRILDEAGRSLASSSTDVTAVKMTLTFARLRTIARSHPRSLVFALLILVLFGLFLMGDRRPFGSKPAKYRIDPASVSPTTATR
jgi:hypothetical protein